MKNNGALREIAFQACLWCIVLLPLAAGCSPTRITLRDPLSPEEHERFGRVYESRGGFDLAAQQYRDALGKNERHLPALLLLGDLSYRLADYSGAGSCYEKALAVDPGNSAVRNNLAWVYIRTEKRLDRAKELITEALSLDPDNRSFYLDTLGVILLKQGRTEEAVTALRESVAAFPKDRPDLLREAEQHLAEACRAAQDGTRCREIVERR